MKLLISDLDGTLYPHRNAQNPHQFEDNMAAVKRWVDSGNKFAVATARGFHHLPVLMEKIGFPVNFIGCNGAAVRYENGEEVVKQLPCRIFIDLCNFVKAHHIDASVTTGLDNEWIWSRNDGYPRGLEAYAHIWDSIVVADLAKIDPEAGVERIQIFTPPEKRDQLKEQLLQLPYHYSVTCSDQNLIDVGPYDASKGIAISAMCDKFSIDKQDIIVVGDSLNDVAMFDLTAHSYCIDHAEQAVQAKATHVVSSLAMAIDMEMQKIK